MFCLSSDRGASVAQVTSSEVHPAAWCDIRDFAHTNIRFFLAHQRGMTQSPIVVPVPVRLADAPTRLRLSDSWASERVLRQCRLNDGYVSSNAVR